MQMTDNAKEAVLFYLLIQKELLLSLNHPSSSSIISRSFQAIGTFGICGGRPVWRHGFYQNRSLTTVHPHYSEWRNGDPSI